MLFKIEKGDIMDQRTSGKQIEFLPMIALVFITSGISCAFAPGICLWLFGVPIKQAPFLYGLVSVFLGGLSGFIAAIIFLAILVVILWIISGQKINKEEP